MIEPGDDLALGAPGKPFGDIVISPYDADEEWMRQYWAWKTDETGDVPPPSGYEDWNVEAALEDVEAEEDRISAIIREQDTDRRRTDSKV